MVLFSCLVLNKLIFFYFRLVLIHEYFSILPIELMSKIFFCFWNMKNSHLRFCCFSDEKFQPYWWSCEGWCGKIMLYCVWPIHIPPYERSLGLPTFLFMSCIQSIQSSFVSQKALKLRGMRVYLMRFEGVANVVWGYS